MLLNLLFPKYCINCKTKGTYICNECEQKITRQKQICVVCRKYAPFGVTHSYCAKHTPLHAVIIATEYKTIIKKTLLRIKYNHCYDIVNELLEKTLQSQKIIQTIQSYNCDYCTDIPMHAYKENQRGFNQTNLMTRWIEKRIKIPYAKLLKKNKPTESQMRLARKDRLYNLKNAFIMNEKIQIKNKTILLIDDVITTGATLEETATVLKQNGAKTIIALALASSE